jgi:hypothetical protein
MLAARPELSPVAEAMCRLLAEAVVGESPETMTREVEAIVSGWWGEDGVDHLEIERRLAVLNDELVSCVEAGRRPSHPFKNWRSPDVKRKLLHRHGLALERLVVAHEAVCRSRTRSLV